MRAYITCRALLIVCLLSASIHPQDATQTEPSELSLINQLHTEMTDLAQRFEPTENQTLLEHYHTVGEKLLALLVHLPAEKKDIFVKRVIAGLERYKAPERQPENQDELNSYFSSHEQENLLNYIANITELLSAHKALERDGRILEQAELTRSAYLPPNYPLAHYQQRANPILKYIALPIGISLGSLLIFAFLSNHVAQKNKYETSLATYETKKVALEKAFGYDKNRGKKKSAWQTDGLLQEFENALTYDHLHHGQEA